MKKLKLFLACVLMTIFSIGQVWADVGDLYYTFTPQKPSSGAVSDYTKTGDQTVDGMTWNVPGNWYGTGALRIGGKSISEVNRTITGKSQMGDAIAQIVITHQGVTSDNLVLNSVKLTKASNSAFSSDVETKTLTKGTDFTYSKNAAGTITFTPAGDSWAKDSYYKFDFNISNSNSSNYAFVINKIEFYSFEEAAACSNTVAITKGAETNGTYTLSATSVCGDGDGEDVTISDITPAAGYEFDEITTSASGTVDNVNKKVTGITAATTITVKFKALTSYTVTWNVNGDESLTSSVYEGSKPAFPTPAPTSCDASSTTFIGWATGAWAGKVASVTETLYTSADAMPAVTGAVTYYAVFAKVGGEASNLFSWAGGSSADFAAIEGVELSADGTDYAAANDPYLIKWNGTGKYAIIPVSAQPGKVSIGVKMIGGSSSSKITVQESTSTTGSFTDVEELTISGASNDEVDLETTKSFKATTRAIKLYYTKGSNVGLGPISIEGVAPISDYMTTCAAAGQCAAPTFSVAGGTYNAAQSVELSCETDGATIHYTTNGDAPTSSSATYSSAIAVNENMTIKAIAVKDGSTDSEVAEAVYVLKPATPTISGTDNFLESSTITLACETDGAAIYYTTNGDAPTSSSELYSAPFDIDATTTVKAIAIIANWTNSEVATQEFKKVPTYTVAEALAVIDALADNASTDSVCVRGVIKEITEVNTGYKNATYLIQDGGVENELTVFRGKYINKADFTDENKDNLQLGDEVLVKGKLKKYVKNEVTTPEIDQNNYIVTYHTKTLADVQVDGAVTKTEYNKGEAFAFNGLQAHAIYDTYYMEDIPFDEVEWTADPATITKDTVVEVGASWHSVSCGYIAPVAVTLKKYQLNYILPAQGTLSIKQDETLVSSGTKWVEGTEFTLSSTVPSDDYKAGVYTVTDWMEPANDVTADVLSGNTLTMPKYNVIVTVAFPEKAAAPISWSNSGAAVNVHIDNTDDLPTLTKGEFTVTCNSSDENVATVDNDGVVTMVGAGTTTISAVFAGDDDYKAKTVSYELTVLPDFYIAGNFTSWGDNKIPVAGESKTINLAAGNYELKVVTTADEWKGFENLDAATVVSGIYAASGGDANICFKLDAASNVTVSYVGGKISLVGNFAVQEIKVAGDAPFTWDGAVLELAENKLTASKTFTALEAKSYAVKMINGGSWLGNGGTINRENPSTLIVVNGDNMSFVADMAGDYTFTWTFATRTLTVTYPALPEKEYYVAGSFTNWETGKVKMTTTDDETWTATVALEADKTGANKYEFKIIETQLADTWLGLENAASMVYGNCTDWTIGGGGANIGLETTKAADYTFTYVPATKKLSVNIPQKEAGISWNASTATAYTKGKSYELPTLSNPNGLLVELSSSDEAVAYLDEGQLKIAGAGTATITATSAATGVYAAGEASYTLNVYGPAALAISGEATKTSYEKGDAFDRTGLVASVLYGDASVLVVTDLATWTADPATVTANGNVTVTAEWEGLSDDEEVAVTVKTHKVTFKDYDEDYHVYLSVWNGETQISSGDEFAKGTVLTVEVELESADYVLATLTANTTDIKATKQFTIGEVDVTIEATTEQKPLAPISWSAESASIAMNGDVATLPTLVNELGLGIRYMSNNEEAATIDENTGVITLVGAGVTTITAQSIATEEGAYRTTSVTYTLTVVAIPTALDNAEAGEKAQKIMLNNQLFILRGGKIYDAQGKLVK